MEKKHPMEQPPFNPYMFPFPFPFHPPPFMNPIMPIPPKCPPVRQSEHPHPYPPSGLPMPHFPFAPFPMMYPPPPQAFFRMHQGKGPAKEAKDLKVPSVSNNKIGEQPANAGKKGKQALLQADKKSSVVIVLSDDQSKIDSIQPSSKKNISHQPKPSADSTQDVKTKRTERKHYPPEKIELPIKKTRKIQKKEKSKAFFKEKEELKNLDINEVKYVLPTNEAPQEYLSRSTRIKCLTIKQGKGKILIGDEFQARLTSFLAKDECYSVWVCEKKASLLGRFLKDKP